MESAFVILSLIFGFVILMNLVQARAKDKRERFRLIEAAIRSGNLDPDTKQDLVKGLTGRRPWHGAKEGPGLKFVFALGWLGLFVGGALMSVDRGAFEAGVVICALSFGVVTLPFAMRELEGRRQARDARN